MEAGTKLIFTIPTWNRAGKLKRCVESMLLQLPDGIVISDNGSDDGTQELCMKLVDQHECVKYIRYDDHVDFAGSYQRAVNGVDGDGYTWTFGDDDVLEDSAYAFVKGVIKSTQYDFYHVAETSRTNKSAATTDTVLNICKSIGWLDTTGFISGNIAKSDKFRETVSTPNYPLFATSSYPQSLGILEVMADSPAMLIELGCVASGSMDNSVGEQWKAADTCWKYLYVGDGLRALADQGKIPAKFPEVFFRYLDENLFSRLMRDFNALAVTNPTRLKPSDWDTLENLANMVEGDRGCEISNWIQQVKIVSQRDQRIYQAAIDAYEEMKAVAGAISMPTYPWVYLPGGESSVES